MKYQRILYYGAIVLVLFGFAGISEIFAQISLPGITTACELKNGQLYAFDDGFSVKTACQGNSRKVVLMAKPGDAKPSAMPKPDFTSGWIEFAGKASVIDVPHNLGGNIDDYLIDVTYRRPASNGTYMSHQTAANSVWWEDVTPTNIQVVRNGDVSNLFDAFRVRIWVINN